MRIDSLNSLGNEFCKWQLWYLGHSLYSYLCVCTNVGCWLSERLLLQSSSIFFFHLVFFFPLYICTGNACIEFFYFHRFLRLWSLVIASCSLSIEDIYETTAIVKVLSNLCSEGWAENNRLNALYLTWLLDVILMSFWRALGIHNTLFFLKSFSSNLCLTLLSLIDGMT